MDRSERRSDRGPQWTDQNAGQIASEMDHKLYNVNQNGHLGHFGRYRGGSYQKIVLQGQVIICVERSRNCVTVFKRILWFLVYLVILDIFCKDYSSRVGLRKYNLRGCV